MDTVVVDFDADDLSPVVVRTWFDDPGGWQGFVADLDKVARGRGRTARPYTVVDDPRLVGWTGGSPIQLTGRPYDGAVVFVADQLTQTQTPRIVLAVHEPGDSDGDEPALTVPPFRMRLSRLFVVHANLALGNQDLEEIVEAEEHNPHRTLAHRRAGRSGAPLPAVECVDNPGLIAVSALRERTSPFRQLSIFCKQRPGSWDGTTDDGVVCVMARRSGLDIQISSASGLMQVTVEEHDSPPAADEDILWSEVVEHSLPTDGDGHLLITSTSPRYWISNQSARCFAVRIHVAGRDESTALRGKREREDRELPEQYLIQFWPAAPAPAKAMRLTDTFGARRRAFISPPED